jgi:hypothetical protein
MPSFDTSGNTVRTPFGKNQYLRSTKDVKPESYTCAKGAVPVETIDGAADQKVLQSGEFLAKITSGPDIGKVGPFQAGVTDGRQTPANIVGVNDTFLPWQLMERDVEVAAVYEASVVQAWCFERNAAGARIPLSNATRDAILALPQLALRFS